MDNGVVPKFLVCIECNEEFCFTIQAQEYFAERGYSDDPKRCKTCHTMHKKTHRNEKSQTQTQTQYPD